jgi:preprotein translocase SecE subunit
MGRYLKGAWVELRQVRWPTRGATWSLTGAVLLFTGFFVVMVLLLDAGFKFLFEKILG